MAAVKEKLSVSLDRDLVEKIREVAGDGHVSEWLNDAVLLRLQAKILADLISEHGPVSAEIRAQVKAEWPSDD
jgi:hypothetical protein